MGLPTELSVAPIKEHVKQFTFLFSPWNFIIKCFIFIQHLLVSSLRSDTRLQRTDVLFVFTRKIYLFNYLAYIQSVFFNQFSRHRRVDRTTLLEKLFSEALTSATMNQTITVED